VIASASVSAACVLAAHRSARRTAGAQRLELEESGDAVEQQLEARRAALMAGLARRSTQVYARIALASGTGLAVWELASGPTRVWGASAVFACGAMGWIVCAELARRIGSPAGIARRRTRESGPELRD
jgi:hypothetical protein